VVDLGIVVVPVFVVVVVIVVVVIVVTVEVCVVFVVADSGNNDGSILCVQLYEIDVAKPT
jgi:hypothetical protein